MTHAEFEQQRQTMDAHGAEGQHPSSRRIEEQISPDFLKMLSSAAGGFTYIQDDSLPPERMGHTDMRTRRIHYNPVIFEGKPELGIEPLPHPEGFFYHESGHHAPDVIPLQDRMLESLKDIEIPESYKGSVDLQQRFLTAIYTNLGNALADIWLESYLSRTPYIGVRESIVGFMRGMGELSPEHLASLSKPQQLLQTVLSARYFDKEKIAEQISDPDVQQEYRLLVSRTRRNELSPLELIMARSAFERFPTPAGKERALEQKLLAYKEVFLPSYLRLMEKEIEERKQQNQQAQSSTKGDTEGDNTVPLTKEEIESLADQIISELEKAGENHIKATSAEDEKDLEEMNKTLRKKLEEQKKGEADGQEIEDLQPQKKSGLDAIDDLSRELARREKEEAQRGMVAAHQVREQTVKTWENIKDEYREDIESTAAVLADIFLDDRRHKIQYLLREGEIVPGLEYEHIAAMISGESDPETKMRVTQNPEFLETEFEFVVDTSGSMSGDRINQSIKLMVVTVEAFKKVLESLEDENLVLESEKPFRIGGTKYSVGSERVTKLEDPLDDKKELTMIEEFSKIGGGTDESEALRETYQGLRVGADNVIKMIVLLTDGNGNRAAVAPIMRQIEEDNKVIFLAAGLGQGQEHSESIVKSYIEPLQDREEGNVYGIAASNPREVIPGVLDFLKREVGKRRTT